MKIVKLTEAATQAPPKICTYGAAGVGKTRSIATLPGRVLVGSAEAGLLSLAQAKRDDIDVTVIETFADVGDIYKSMKAGAGYDWLVLDSLSEIAEVLLVEEKAKTKDPRQAYGAIADRIMTMLQEVRKLPCGVLYLAKEARIQVDIEGSESTRTTYGVAFPGAQLGARVPFMFDFLLRQVVRTEVVDGKKAIVRRLQTFADGTSDCKDRSGSLEPYEAVDYAAIVSKVYK